MNNRIKADEGLEEAQPFIRIPQVLFTPQFKDLDINSRVLYSVMLDHTKFFDGNTDCLDENGHVCLTYTIEQVMESMRVSVKTAVKMMKQLEDIGLIKRRKRGQGKPDLIYIMDCTSG